MCIITLIVLVAVVMHRVEAFRQSPFQSSSNNLFDYPYRSRIFVRRKKPTLHVTSRSFKLQALVDDDILSGVAGFAEAFIGGTVGVLSVAFLVELRKLNDKNSESCPYCMGNGEILCGACLGIGGRSGEPCAVCGGRGLTVCINCKGDGRITPIVLQSKASRDPVSWLLLHRCYYAKPFTDS